MMLIYKCMLASDMGDKGIGNSCRAVVDWNIVVDHLSPDEADL